MPGTQGAPELSFAHGRHVRSVCRSGHREPARDAGPRHRPLTRAASKRLIDNALHAAGKQLRAEPLSVRDAIERVDSQRIESLKRIN